MADRDFIVKNGLVTGTNNVTLGNAVYITASGNVGIGNSSPTNVLSVNGPTYLGGNLTSSINLTVNTTGVYHTGTINSSSYTVGTSTIANSTGVYTGVVNGSSITIGTSTISNSTGVYTGVVNATTVTTTTVNAASHTVGTSTIANATGVYTGVVNGSSITVGTSTIANSTGVYTGIVNAASHTVGTSTVANATGVYTGVVNATTLSTGSVNVLNASGLTTSANVSVGAGGELIMTAGAGIYANGSLGTATQVLHSNGSSVYWDTDNDGVTSVASGNGITGGTITTTGTLSVVAGTGTVVNTTGVHVNATYIGTLTANNTSFVGSVAAANVVSNTQLSSNLANYQTTAGLNANIASYLPNYSGVINATAINSANLTTTTNTVTFGTSSYFISNGNVGVGTTSPTEKLEVNGNVKISSNLVTGSSSSVSGGFGITAYNIGTLSSGTTTLNPFSGNYQYYTNNGAHTIAAPTSDCAIDILVTNGASAGTITLSGFTVQSGGTGDAYATTNTYKFLLMIRRINGTSTYIWKALQ